MRLFYSLSRMCAVCARFSLLSCVVLATGLSAADAPATIPAPLPLTYEGNDPSNPVVRDMGGQISKIDLINPLPGPEFLLKAPVGNAYTLTFWVRAQDFPNLISSEFSAKTPPTIVDFTTRSGKDSDGQHMIIRVMNGYFMVTELNGKKWASLRGFNQKIVPGQWYFVAYTRTQKQGMLFVNGYRVLRTNAPLVAHDKLQAIVFGSVKGERPFYGNIVEPRLYKVALNDAQVQALAARAPADVR